MPETTLLFNPRASRRGFSASFLMLQFNETVHPMWFFIPFLSLSLYLINLVADSDVRIQVQGILGGSGPRNHWKERGEVRQKRKGSEWTVHSGTVNNSSIDPFRHMCLCVCVCVCVCSVMPNSLRPHVAHQAPLSMKFSRQEYWSGLPFLPPGCLPDPGIEPTSPAMAGRFFTTEATREDCKKPLVPIVIL